MEWKTATQTKIHGKCNLKRMLSVIVAKGSETFDLNWSICLWAKPSGSLNKLQCCCSFGKFWNMQFKLAKFFSKKHQDVWTHWKIFCFNTKPTVQITKTFRSFSVGQGFSLQKIQKFWGVPIETNEFHQVCATFDRIWHKHAGLRPAWAHRANTCETCEHLCEQKNLIKQVVRKSCENARKKKKKKNLEKQPGKNRSCEHRANIYPNSTFGWHFTKQIPNFATKSAYSNFWPKIAWVCSKKPSDRKPPEFALKSAYWIFWPILARFFQKPAHFKFLTENCLSFPRTLLCFDSDKNRPTLPGNLRILVFAWKSPKSAQKLLQSKLLTENHANLHSSIFCLECARFVTAIHTLIQTINMRWWPVLCLGRCPLDDIETVNIIKRTLKGQTHINFPENFSIWMIFAPTQHVW